MDNVEYLFDYDLSKCAVVTLYDDRTKSKYRLLVPLVLVERFHLVSVVNALSMSGVVSSTCSDEVLCLLNTIRLSHENR